MSKNVCIITGGTRGLGRELSLVFGKAGHEVIAIYKQNETAATSLREDFERGGINGKCVAHNIAKEPLPNELVFPSKSITLIHNACSQFQPSPIHLQNWELYKELLEISVNGALNLINPYLPNLISAEEANVINILSSALGSEPPKGFSAYTAAKSALKGFSESFKSEYSNKGINVQTFSPDFMETGMTDAWPERLKEAVLANARSVSPADVASQIYQLANKSKKSTDDMEQSTNAVDRWTTIKRETIAAKSLGEVIQLSALRRKLMAEENAAKKDDQTEIKIALHGGYAFSPFKQVLEHLLAVSDCEVSFFEGNFDTWRNDLYDIESEFTQFHADIAIFAPNDLALGSQQDNEVGDEATRESVSGHVEEILSHCAKLNESNNCDVIFFNYPLPADFDPGELRVRTLSSEWNQKKLLNMELGLRAPSYLHICDLEFLSARNGGKRCHDERSWLESRQIGSHEFIHLIAKECAHLVCALREAPKKVLVTDLDNTLWGGVVGDDGVEGIELGKNTPKGEAFSRFQSYLKTLRQRGVLLAVSSKNEYSTAKEPFDLHPEMVLKFEDFVCFNANWQCKAENIREISEELGLSLDSMVFIDDSPFEIEAVRRYLPEVETILLDQDPANYLAQLKNSRFFESSTITEEDRARSDRYMTQARREEHRNVNENIGDYLKSLNMEAEIETFKPVNTARIAQLINKTNQFNLTTIRRSETEITELMRQKDTLCLSLRLKDRFGDYGLVGAIIGRIYGSKVEIDTWVQSCRVFERTAEENLLKAFVGEAKTRGITQVVGRYSSTPKNKYVANLYDSMGFELLSEDSCCKRYRLDQLDDLSLSNTVIETRVLP